MIDRLYLTIYLSPAVVSEFNYAYEWYCSHVQQVSEDTLASIIFSHYAYRFPVEYQKFLDRYHVKEIMKNEN